jgi:hypothetical protein
MAVVGIAILIAKFAWDNMPSSQLPPSPATPQPPFQPGGTTLQREGLGSVIYLGRI